MRFIESCPVRTIVLILCFFAPELIAVEPEYEEYYDDGFSPVVLPILLILLVVVLICFGIGVALGAAALAGIALAVGIGVVSAATVAGFVTKKPSNAAKMLILQAMAILFICVGCVLAIGLDYFLLKESEISTTMWAVQGAVGGLIAGLLFGGTINFFLQRVLDFLKDQFFAAKELT